MRDIELEAEQNLYVDNSTSTELRPIPRELAFDRKRLYKQWRRRLPQRGQGANVAIDKMN